MQHQPQQQHFSIVHQIPKSGDGGDGRHFKNPFKSWKTFSAEKSEILQKCSSDIESIFTAISPNLADQCTGYITSFLRLILDPKTQHNHDPDGGIYVGTDGYCVLLLRIIELMDYFDSKMASNQNQKNHSNFNSNSDDNQQVPESKVDDANDQNTDSSKVSDFVLNHWKSLMNDLCTICSVTHTIELRDYLLRSILTFNNLSIGNFKSRRRPTLTLILGIAGPFAIRIVYYFYVGNDKKMKKYISEIKALYKSVLKLEAHELLYGRMGYVAAFLFIDRIMKRYHNNNNTNNNNDNAKNKNKNKNMDKDLTLNLLQCKEVEAVCDSVIEEGRKYVKHSNISFLSQNGIPMMWEWHQSNYFGGAHGVVGIVITMCSIPNVFRKHRVILCSMMECCHKYFRFKSGNYASSLRGVKRQKDKLVQFCHGAPGFVSCFATLSVVVGKHNAAKWMEYADEAAEVVWNRGILTKGTGLCHGTGGNGYSFLSGYRMRRLQDLKYLYRAIRFAQVVVDDNVPYPSEPDSPNSLFEGECGGVFYVLDVLFAAENATFPCYEWL